MDRTYREPGRRWTRLLTDDPACPIPVEWVDELSRTFVGDTSTERVGAFMTSMHCPWSIQLPVFEHFGVPIWVRHFEGTEVHPSLRHYVPSKDAIAQQRVNQARQCDDWGQGTLGWDGASTSGWGRASTSGWDMEVEQTNWSQRVIGWGNQAAEENTAPNAPLEQAAAVGNFPAPERNSGQRHGEHWRAFFARRREENKIREEMESPVQRQSRQSRELAAKNHNVPSKSSNIAVFEWQPHEDFPDFLLRIRLTKAQVPSAWGSYNKFTRLFDGFRNEWDLCDALNPTSTPDGDWEEDDFPPEPAPVVPAPVPPVPPTRSSFLRDIDNYFGRHEVAPSSDYTAGIEAFMSILHFHLGYRLTAMSSVPHGRFPALENWVNKTEWRHLVKMIGDNLERTPDIKSDVIKAFIGYLVTLPRTELLNIPEDLWDLGPSTSLMASNLHIRVLYAQPLEMTKRIFIIEPATPGGRQIWKLELHNLGGSQEQESASHCASDQSIMLT